MNQPRVAVESKNDRFIGGEQRIEVGVRESVRMLAGGLQGHEIDHVDHADLELGNMPAQQVDCGQSLESRHVTAAGHDYVRLAAAVVARPFPDAQSRRSQCLIAWSIVSHCGAGCLPATITFT